ncbi:hypothetical protein C0991_010731 [Blastosporella zonata]|nr:hypothetical protein C0991_010731 [Blastosporella zonata]
MPALLVSPDPYFHLINYLTIYHVAFSNDSTSNTDLDSFYADAPYTDTAHIADTLGRVSQKGGPAPDELPNSPVPNTVVTALDGKLSTVAIAPAARSVWSRRSDSLKPRASNHVNFWAKRTNSGYSQVFDGTGTQPQDRDGSIEGTAYLTYTVVSNATYNVDDCLAASRAKSRITVFANLYYEYNNDLLDHVFSEKSNLKCALYADIHTAAEKTNLGGQQSEPAPAGLTYIQQSSGWAAKSLADPDCPDGYELVYGPTDGANNAPGYMGFAFIDKYDVNACATLCDNRDPDPQGGHCKFFNIWRAVVNGQPTTYTCSMYFFPADSSTAVNYGQGDLKVTWSRGYRKSNACSSF